MSNLRVPYLGNGECTNEKLCRFGLGAPPRAQIRGVFVCTFSITEIFTILVEIYRRFSDAYWDFVFVFRVQYRLYCKCLPLSAHQSAVHTRGDHLRPWLPPIPAIYSITVSVLTRTRTRPPDEGHVHQIGARPPDSACHRHCALCGAHISSPQAASARSSPQAAPPNEVWWAGAPPALAGDPRGAPGPR